MNWLLETFRRLARLRSRTRDDADLAEEMRLHLDLRAADAAAAGHTPQDAASEARRRFGNVTRLREKSREAWGWAFWDNAAQDVRYGVRSLRANPGFTLIAVLSLTLGIGANTALFSIINAVMLRSLPVAAPEALVRVESGKNTYFTNPIWEALRDRQQFFAGAFAYSTQRFNLTDGGESQFAHGLWASGDFFHTLGVPAIRGRVLTNTDDRHGCGSAGPVAVISYSFWQSHFAADPNVVGRSLKLDRHRFEIVGVTPPWFTGLDVDQKYDVAIPIGCEPVIHTDSSALDHRSWWWLRVVGRLLPGESIAQAGARITALSPEIARATVPQHWDAAGQSRYLKRTFSLAPARTGYSATGERYRTALFTLMVAVGLVLLIACANIANLLLARATARQREISVRLAIGASRLRVIRQLLTESLLVSFMGAAGGLLFAIGGGRILVRLLSTAGNELQLDPQPDWNVLAFTGLVAVATGLLFGMLPALRATSHKPNDVLKEGARGSVTGSTRFHLGKALVVAQVGLSLILLVGTGLFGQTLRNLLTVDTGFDRHSLLLVKATIPPARIAKERRVELYTRVLQRLRSIPAVSSLSASLSVPVSNWVWNEGVHPEGYSGNGTEDDTLVYFNRVTPGYFQTMGIGLVAGRDFDERDNLASPRVIVIGRAAAEHFWPAANPIGKTISLDRPRNPGKLDPYRVVGVVRDIKYQQLDEKTLMTGYVPTAQDDDPGPDLVYELRIAGRPEAVSSDVRAAVAEVDPSMSLEFRSQETLIADSLMQQRLLALLSGFFGLLALCLAVTGLYGVVSYMTTRRRGEIGVRVALGADYAAVLRLVLSDVVLVVSAGVVLGTIAALATGRLVTSLCYGVSPADPRVLSAAAALLAFATGLAGYLPARRAARMDPMAALRDE